MAAERYLLLVALAGAAWAAANSNHCQHDIDCSLNGVCQVDGSCQCDPWWSGDDCGKLSFEPNSAFVLYNTNRSTSSWGGSVKNLTSAEGGERYILYAAEFANGCSLGQWSPTSTVILAESTQYTGPFEKLGEVLGPFHHNPTVVQHPDGHWLMFVIGHNYDGPLPNCRNKTAPADPHSHTDRIAIVDPAPGNNESNITLFWADRPDSTEWHRVGVYVRV